MKLRFTPRAVHDIANIADYIHARNPAAAKYIRAALVRSLQQLVRFPQLGRAQAIKSVRKLVVRKYPYLIYYTVDNPQEEIIILTIRHSAREREHEDA